jgi:hypothetical protein
MCRHPDFLEAEVSYRLILKKNVTVYGRIAIAKMSEDVVSTEFVERSTA